MINLPLNFSAPTGQVQNTYTAPTRTNSSLTPSQYQGMQLHTPSGLYYQGGTMYEPFTPTPPQPQAVNFYGSPLYSQPLNPFDYNRTPPEPDNSIKVGEQYFRPFTGNAQGVVNGNLSMVGMLGSQPTYQPQGIPNSLLNFLPPPSMSQTGSQPSFGAGRFLGLLDSNNTLPNINQSITPSLMTPMINQRQQDRDAVRAARESAKLAREETKMELKANNMNNRGNV
jgi:hypothetical protein